MNRICRRFEAEFDNYIAKHGSDTEFDYTIMKSGAEYTETQYRAIVRLYGEYTQRVHAFIQTTSKSRYDEDENKWLRAIMVQDFTRECLQVCSNETQLCDILLDVCYKKESSKQFVWDLASQSIVDNLLRNNGGVLSFPMRDDGGEIEFCGERFAMVHKKIGEDSSEYCSE